MSNGRSETTTAKIRQNEIFNSKPAPTWGFRPGSTLAESPDGPCRNPRSARSIDGSVLCSRMISFGSQTPTGHESTFIRVNASQATWRSAGMSRSALEGNAAPARVGSGGVTAQPRGSATWRRSNARLDERPHGSKDYGCPAGARGRCVSLAAGAVAVCLSNRAGSSMDARIVSRQRRDILKVTVIDHLLRKWKAGCVSLAL
jgi:hypothetical protein